jgi:hypothetical protein
MKNSRCILLAALVLEGCSFALSDTPASGPKSFAELCEEPTRYEQQVVELEGIFQGWRIAECRFPVCASQAITRSDWVISNEGDCLYVTGGKPVNFDPINPESVGHRIQLEAKVVMDKDQKVYLEYFEARSFGP